MDLRPLGHTGLLVSPIGFGAFKIGRDTGAKYPDAYEVPDEDAVAALLHGILDLGVVLMDTAPAYGTSEERIGRCLEGRREEYVLCTKVGEHHEDGVSSHDFSEAAVHASIDRSLRRLRTDRLDVVLVHADGDDVAIQEDTGCIEALMARRDAGDVGAVGFSGKTLEGARRALAWADVLMVTYHLGDTSHEAVLREAAEAGRGVLIKKPLGAGTLAAEQALAFLLRDAPARDAIGSVVVGTLSLDHVRRNVALAG